MNETDLARKARQETAHGLWRQRNFRDEDDGLFTAPYCFFRRADVEFGFARASHAMQQKRDVCGLGCKRCVDFLPGFFLFRGKCRGFTLLYFLLHPFQGITPDFVLA